MRVARIGDDRAAVGNGYRHGNGRLSQLFNADLDSRMRLIRERNRKSKGRHDNVLRGACSDGRILRAEMSKRRQPVRHRSAEKKKRAPVWKPSAILVLSPLKLMWLKNN